VEPEPRGEPRPSVAIRVRCLDCGAAYAKPVSGGTMATNPGCPRCGYSGWITGTIGVTSATDVQPSHSVAGLRQLHGGRPH
jgi:hypothetical protein